jgi:hypothetical protein
VTALASALRLGAFMPRNQDKPYEAEERDRQPDDQSVTDLDLEELEPERVRNFVTNESEEEEIAEDDIMGELDDDDLGKMEGPDA